MSWQVNEEVSRDMTDEVDGMNQGVDSRDGVMHIWMSDLWYLMRKWLIGEKGWKRQHVRELLVAVRESRKYAPVYAEIIGRGIQFP